MKLSEGLRKGLAIKEKIGRPYCAAVIVAAGTSSRMGGTNKILTVLENLPVICRTVDVFDKCAMIDEIIVVTQQELLEKVSRYLKAYDKMRMVVAGGETRTDSVMAGLAAVSDQAQLVAVHDGARPLVTDAVICRAVSKAKKFAAAAPAVRVKDTIKVSTGGAVDGTPDRSTALRRPDPAGLRPRSACRSRCRMRKSRASRSRTTAAPSKRSVCPCS
ncbi:MAG: 2-C-methyl-D-erythritol 4-phosphate cytidylyltransferase [Acutalibacteraceae bacterium]